MKTSIFNFLKRGGLASAETPLLTVTGSQRPYIYDLPHLLSLPAGFEFRFRYRHRWVDTTILAAIARNPHAYVGRRIVVIFHSQDSKRVIPIRLATILGIEPIGPMVFVRFRAGAFFKVGLDVASYSYAGVGDADEAAKKLVALAQGVLGPIGGQGPYDFAKALPSGWYLRQSACEVNDTALDHGDPVAAWARMVAVLHGEPSLSGIPFFYLMGFRSEEGSVVKPESIQNRFSPTREAIDGFPLTESRRYRMRVAEWCELPKDVDQRPVLINCEFDKSQFALEGSSNLVVGRYDVIEFTFSCLQPGYSEMALRAEPFRENDHRPCANAVSRITPAAATAPAGGGPAGPVVAAAAPWDTWPAVFVSRVPVVVTARPARTLLPFLSLAAGLVLYLFLAPRIGAKYGEKWKGISELAALGILYFGYGTIIQHLERLFKLSRGVRKLGGGPAAWEKQDKD
jgi:hypothetical protein